MAVISSNLTTGVNFLMVPLILTIILSDVWALCPKRNRHFLQEKQSRHGLTIRRNKQSVRTNGSSSSHLSRTESPQSNNVGTASNTIPDTLLSHQ